MATTLITGANRGIGLELVRQSAASGAKNTALVFAACRNRDNAGALQKLAAGSAGRVQIVPLDVASDASVAALKQTIGATPIDMLINNAGIMGPDPQSALKMDFEGFAEVLNVNLLGALRVSQALMDNVAAARGTIAVISSMMGQYDYTGTNKLAYCVSKTAVMRAFHMLAGDVKRKGVKIAILSPGWVKTDMGGMGAPLTAAASAAGMLQQIANWTLEESGRFKDYEGRVLEW